MISVKVIENSNNLFYDINGICENADSIYWTQVPYEVYSLVETHQYYLTSCLKNLDLKDVVTWW